MDRPATEAEIRDRAERIRQLKALWPVGTTAELLVAVFGISLLALGLIGFVARGVAGI